MSMPSPTECSGQSAQIDQGPTPRVLAFYLPQFHPIPENDEWWGKGFTEWTNVVKTRPRFNGHHQPQLPSDFGFYDLRVPETRQAQADLAEANGISGFCYYHYWFNGQRLLERPFQEVLESGSPSFPFCLCWANENWTRAWDGLERQVLMGQRYDDEDSVDHIKWLQNAFADDRYITVEGRPLLLIYRADSIPNVDRMLGVWRETCQRDGMADPFICAVQSGFSQLSDDALLSLGFDALIDFQPSRRYFPADASVRSVVYRAARKLLPDSVYQYVKLRTSASNIVDYKRFVEQQLERSWPTDFLKFPCVFPSWDNSARRSSATIIQNDDPGDFGKWVDKALGNVSSYPDHKRLVFVNAWNEWAEGCHLEPDQRHGHAFLEQIQAAVHQARVNSGG